MKDIVKSMLILTVIYLLLFFLVRTNRQSQVIQEKQSQPVIITDTITNVLYDTIFIDHFETVKLQVVDTLTIINDSIRIDSVFVEVPISIYKFDTCFTTDSTNLNIMIRNSGFNVTLDSLSYNFKYTPTHQKTNFFKDHFKFGAGISTGYGVFSKKLDVFMGIGFYYCF